METTCSWGWCLWAMGRRKAPLKLAETKGIGNQHFPHPKTQLSEHPELFGSALKL